MTASPGYTKCKTMTWYTTSSAKARMNTFPICSELQRAADAGDQLTCDPRPLLIHNIPRNQRNRDRIHAKPSDFYFAQDIQLARESGPAAGADKGTIWAQCSRTAATRKTKATTTEINVTGKKVRLCFSYVASR